MLTFIPVKINSKEKKIPTIPKIKTKPDSIIFLFTTNIPSDVGVVDL